ncbi:hypothetical protein V9T40_003180 [Parthenolecanium corni]|uniref:Retinol dehydrogenase 12 n=1 Tax=Parthenolecanium corni TaxID=536013 RepID=A0AAN9TUJ5_9HEMI
MGWIFSEMCQSETRLDGKVAIVTGCNTGIGKETIAEFYRRGAKVIAACRDIQKTQAAIDDIKESTKELQNVGSFVIQELDLSSFESVRKCAERILQTEPSIHLLVDNAGIMACPKQLSKDGYELQFATNHLGHFLFTLLLLPRIIKSAPARIVIVASSAHQFGDGKMHFEDINLDNGYTPSHAYGRSKTANILFARELGKRLKGTGVTTYSLHPGIINTELGRHLHETYPWTSRLANFFIKSFGKTPIQGAQTTLYCALDEKCANETGLYYAECAVSTPMYRARCDERAAELWNESIKLVKLENYDPFQPA